MTKKVSSMFKSIELLESSSDYLLYRKIKSQERSLRIFNDNYLVLMESIQLHNSPEHQEVNWNDYRERDKMLWLILRQCHNFLASAFSLIEHTRKHYRKINESGIFRKEYQDKINDEFANWPLHIFLKDLRNFMLHYRLPLIRTTIHYLPSTRIDGQATLDKIPGIKLEISEIENFDWNKRSKEFISSNKRYIDLELIFEEYFIRITEFQSWYQSKLREYYHKRLVTLFSEIRKIMLQAEEERCTGLIPITLEELEEQESLLGITR